MSKEIQDPPRYLAFVTASPPKRATDLAIQLANHYAQVDLSRSKWRGEPEKVCRWRLVDKSPSGDGSLVPTERSSKPFSAEKLRKHLLKLREFRHAEFDLPCPDTPWLDANLDVSTPSHFTDLNGDTVRIRTVTGLGDSFPLAPLLDREGASHTSFQKILLTSILTGRVWLTENSDQFQTLQWLERLRVVVNEAVSLVENTLHQFYYKAKYAPLDGWMFEEDRLPGRVGGRMTDKLRWVGLITGSSLNHPIGVQALRRVKVVRNHLQHFDPPIFAFSLEDVTEWLNDLLLVAELVWQLRRCLRALPSNSLIELLLAPEVAFVSPHPEMRRSRQSADAGYSSSSEQRLLSGTRWQSSTSQGEITLRWSREETVISAHNAKTEK